MNLLDVLIILIVGLQAAWWARIGLTRGLFSLAGFWAGFVLGALLAPLTVGLAGGPLSKLVVAIVTILGLATLFGTLGKLAGIKLSGLTRRLKLGSRIDVAAGTVFGAVMTLVVVWLLAAALGGTPFREINRQIRNSAILQAMDQRLPPAPSVLSRIASLINPHGFPQVFVGPEPRPIEPVDPPSTAEIAAAIEAAGVATVRLEGVGCGGLVVGSGFVAAPGVVVTNAHVVAGIEDPTVVDINGSRNGQTVYFDSDQDIAVLRADNLAGEPLPIAGSIQARGISAVTLGYPGGGRLDATAAGVLRYIEAARGRNIYGQGLVIRSIYELQTSVSSGNSGGPVVLPDGTVIGMVFARSESEPQVGYGVVSPRIIEVLNQVQDLRQPVSSGRCVPR